MSKELKVEHLPRQIIENKLLARLEERGCVAILASKEDCELIIRALRGFESETPVEYGKRREFAQDLAKLVEEAFE